MNIINAFSFVFCNCDFLFLGCFFVFFSCWESDILITVNLGTFLEGPKKKKFYTETVGYISQDQIASLVKVTLTGS